MLPVSKPKRGITKYNVAQTGATVWFWFKRTDGQIVCALSDPATQIDCETEVFSADDLQLVTTVYKSINKVSDSQKAKNKIYNKIRPIFLDNHKICQAKLHGCTVASREVHHKKGRIGKNFLDITTWLAVCPNCHRWIEANPEAAKSLGLSDNRT
jgi:hypothetical protein